MNENKKDHNKSLEESAENNKEKPPIPQRMAKALEDAPPEVRKGLEVMMASIERSGPMPHPYHAFFEKFNSEHITKFLEIGHDDDRNSYNLARSGRRYNLAYAIIGVAFLVFIIVYLTQNGNQPLLTEIFKGLIAFTGGFGGGFGVKSFIDRKK